jgi:nicotinate-nucleotide adenylyltransferase
MAAAEDRYRMICMATEGESGFEVSRMEIDREGPSYTIDTLRELEKNLPAADIFFITGVDSFKDIQTWRRWEELLDSYPFVVHGRPGCGLHDAHEAVPEHMRSRLITLPEAAPPPAGGEVKIYLIRIMTIDISSTDIRAMVRKGRSIRYLVPSRVEAFICEHRLYREGD